MKENELFDWAAKCGFAVTICDCNASVIYMNEKSKATFAKYGNIIGSSLKGCHSPKSWEMIQKLLSTGSSNSYTITKNGINKLIHQTPWFTEEPAKGILLPDGRIVGGLVELSIELPADMPHYNRDAQ
ncbi:MAG: PAS sensor protein [Bacteroidales bacterium]|nr:PAS sensor protein [Bacteroidales bacterium]